MDNFRWSIRNIEIILTGSINSGKTTLQKEFKLDHLPEIESLKSIKSEYKKITVDGWRVSLQVIDTFGLFIPNEFLGLFKNRDTYGIMIIFDLMDRKSFHNI